MSEKLKPCPFCGRTDFRIKIENSIHDEFMHSREYPCVPILRRLSKITLFCPCGFSFERDCCYWEDFKEAWNRRAMKNE